MSLTAIEVMSNGYKLSFVQIPDSCFIPNNSGLREDEFVMKLIRLEQLYEVVIYRLKSFGKQVSPVTQIQI